jgi:hypothetical protein
MRNSLPREESIYGPIWCNGNFFLAKIPFAEAVMAAAAAAGGRGVDWGGAKHKRDSPDRE